MTPETLSSLYCDARKRYAPSGVEWDPHDCLGWVTEPYVYYDLYFYRYLLATSAAAWFAERIEAGDSSAADRLKTLLRAGPARMVRRCSSVPALMFSIPPLSQQ